MKIPTPHCVIYGNPVEGYRIVGPFEDLQEARDYVASDPSDRDMWVAELDAPAEHDEPSLDPYPAELRDYMLRHPDTYADWQLEVARDDTKLGYDEWLVHRVEDAR